ncbi:GumC family protein [Planctomycetota bacterium]
MNELDKFHEPAIGQEVVDWQVPSDSEGETTSDLVAGIVRRWYVVLLVFILICTAGLPAVWLIIKPQYEVVGAVRVDPVLADIMSGDQDPGTISDYDRFINTEAERITSSAVIQRVADELKGRDLAYFQNDPNGLVSNLVEKLMGPSGAVEPAFKLKKAIVGSQKIMVAAESSQELIKVTMFHNDSEEAKQIVDAFIKAYMDIGVVRANDDENQRLKVLEAERDQFAEKIKSYRKSIRELGDLFGQLDLSYRQQMMMDRVASLLDKLTTAEAERIQLEAEVMFLERTKEQPMAQQELLQLRQAYVNGDPAVTAYAENIMALEQELIVAKQTFSDKNPEIQRKTDLLNTMKEHLKGLKQEASDAFDEMANKQAAAAGEKMLSDRRNELEQKKAFEQRLRDTLSKEDVDTINTGRKQLDIEDLQTELTSAQERYDMVQKSIQDLELQRKRPTRISVYYNAEMASIQDKRIKLSIALVFGGLVCGAGFAYLRDRADQCLRTPDDVAKRIGIRIIGTTTSLDTVKPALLPEQIVGDYQTIRANLKLLGGNKIPKKLVVTSPGMREGKTTFAVNLATSMAESGLKVLLIDGDLRKPDVARLLNLPEGSRGLQDVLCGVKFEQAVYSVAATGLDVLAADFTDATDAYEMLAQPATARIINLISRQYDHVIIDTPPVLGFPDALMWAKIGNAAILISYAGHTTMPDLRQAKERLAQIKVKVLGTVLSSVQAGHGYYRHGHSYYAQTRDSARVSRRKLMFSTDGDEMEDMDIEIDPSAENYSYSQSTQTRKAVVRTRKKASASVAKGSDNNKSAKAAKKTTKKKA